MQGQVMRSHQEAGIPHGKGVGAEGGDAASQYQATVGRLCHECTSTAQQALNGRCSLAGVAMGEVEATTYRVAHHKGKHRADQQGRQGDSKKSAAPAILVDHPGAGTKGNDGRKRRCGGVATDGKRTPVRWVDIGNDRHRGRGAW
ncbi:hypothetical protein D3C81_878990 [compost metagenome]